MHTALELAGPLRAVKQFVDDVRFPLVAHHFDDDAETSVDVYGYHSQFRMVGKRSAFGRFACKELQPDSKRTE